MVISSVGRAGLTTPCATPRIPNRARRSRSWPTAAEYCSPRRRVSTPTIRCVGMHLTAGDAGRLAAKAGANLLVLTHLRAWQDHLRLLDEAAQTAGCPAILAHPGLRVAL